MTITKELTKAEYERLLVAAKDKKNEHLYYLMQTICSSGIRVSELSAITIESIQWKRMMCIVAKFKNWDF